MSIPKESHHGPVFLRIKPHEQGALVEYYSPEEADLGIFRSLLIERYARFRFYTARSLVFWVVLQTGIQALIQGTQVFSVYVPIFLLLLLYLGGYHIALSVKRQALTDRLVSYYEATTGDDS